MNFEALEFVRMDYDLRFNSNPRPDEISDKEKLYNF